MSILFKKMLDIINYKDMVTFNNLHIKKDFIKFFKAVGVSTHDNNMIWHVVIVFGIYCDKKLSIDVKTLQ